MKSSSKHTFFSFFSLTLLIALLCFQCKEEGVKKDPDVLLAKAGKRSLYLSDLADLFPENSTAADSNNILLNYIDKWVRETILLNEAEKYIADKIDINRLVNDYRESLLIHNYEEQLVEERLDTAITIDEKTSFYEKNKEDYRLGYPIVKVFYAIIPAGETGLSAFKKSWIKQDVPAMQAYAEKYQVEHSFDETIWITFAQLINRLPEDLFSERQLKSGRSLDRESEGMQYFVKVLESRDENEIAPLAYIEDKIEKVILYNRKSYLLSNIKQKLYERELAMKNIKIYDLK